MGRAAGAQLTDVLVQVRDVQVGWAGFATLSARLSRRRHLKRLASGPVAESGSPGFHCTGGVFK